MNLSLRKNGFGILALGIIPLLFLGVMVWGHLHGGPEEPMFEGQNETVTYVLSHEATQKLQGDAASLDVALEKHMEEMSPPIFSRESLGNSVLFGPETELNRFVLYSPRKGHQDFEQWLTQEIGPENWRPEYVNTFRLHRTINSQAYGVISWKQAQSARDGSVETQRYTSLVWEYTLNIFFSHEGENFYVDNTCVVYPGPPWIGVLVLLYLPLIPLYLLRRPLGRVLRSIRPGAKKA